MAMESVAEKTKKPTLRNYLTDIVAISEAAVGRNVERVASYADRICQKLDADGLTGTAARLRKAASAKEIARLLPLPVDRDSRCAFLEESQPNGVQLVLSNQQELVVSRFIACHEASARLIEAGVGVSSRMLIHGPPGCGKTTIAHHIAECLRLPMLLVVVDRLVNSHLGVTGNNIRDLFEHVGSRPCVLFMDEFDAISPQRAHGEAPAQEMQRVVVSLIQNLDALPPESVVLAATNRPEALDAAVWRRFPSRLEVCAPGEQARAAMVRQFLFDKFPCEGNETEFVSATESATGADIQHAASECIRDAILMNETHVAVASFRQRMDEVINAQPT